MVYLKTMNGEQAENPTPHHTPENRRDRLRKATAVQHKVLDDLVGEKNYFANLDGYRAWLRAGDSFHRDVECQLLSCAAQEALPLAAYRHKTSLLGQDLSDLAWPSATFQSAAVWPCPTLAEALGILYVMEGASMGARVLLIRARKLGVHESYGARHLGYSAHEIQSWRRFLLLLETTDCGPEDEALMIAAAQRTFAAAADHMSQCQPINQSP